MGDLLALSVTQKVWRRSYEEGFNILIWTHRPIIRHDFQFHNPCAAPFGPSIDLQTALSRLFKNVT